MDTALCRLYGGRRECKSGINTRNVSGTASRQTRNPPLLPKQGGVGLFPRGCSDQPSQSSAEVTNAWSCASTHVFMALSLIEHRDKFTYAIILKSTSHQVPQCTVFSSLLSIPCKSKNIPLSSLFLCTLNPCSSFRVRDWV